MAISAATAIFAAIALAWTRGRLTPTPSKSAMSSARAERIRATLAAKLSAQYLDVVDDSAAHAGHAGALTGKGHFSVAIVASCFTGLPLLKRHRLVYAALEELMATDIHALSIDARAPDEQTG